MSKSYPLITELYIGVPGAGKTSIAAHFANKYLKQGIPVWSNVPIKGCRILDPKNDIGQYDISNGVLILDEIGTVYNNRDFRNNFNSGMSGNSKGSSALEWLKLHRHNHMKIMCFSQGLDFDNRFIGLSQRVYIVSKPRFFRKYFTKSSLVLRHVGIDEQTHEIVDNFDFHPIPLPFFRTRYYFLPPTWKMFNSWEAPVLKPKEWNIY